MQQFSIVVETQTQAQQAVELMWDRLGVRGEIAMVPLDGKVKIDVISEKDLSPQQLEKLPGKQA